MQGDGDETIRRWYMVVREFASELFLEIEQIADVPEVQFFR